VKKTLPPTYFLCAIVFAATLHWLLPVRQLIAFPWRLAGLLPLVAGIASNLIADQALKRHRTTVRPFEESSALVTTGIFAISRNPMYAGMTLILLGVALLLGSLTPFAVVIVLPVLFGLAFVGPEEAMLEERFGDRFREYRARVRKWI